MKKVNLCINGVDREVIVERGTVLLDLLRDNLRLTGAKQSCDRKGQCGACTVIVDKKAVRSCLVKVSDLEGADVITVEGLGTPANPHFIQEAFALTGAIQCGFCTPGMIMATKALLDTNLQPTDEDIKKALRRNLCRCTGYVKIIEAVQLAAKFLRGETTPEAIRPTEDQGPVGVSHPRPSALAKACGTALFTADYLFTDALEVAALRSEVAHARIVSIDVSRAKEMPGVVGVLTAELIKGSNLLKRPPAKDRPVLAGDKVRYIGDPIAAVVAKTRKQAEAALEKIKVVLDPLPVLNNAMDALAEGAIQVHDHTPNLSFERFQVKGDATAALEKSAAMVEARFITQINHQAPLEPEATVAYWEEDPDGDDRLVIIGRSISIHANLASIQEALGWENMRYIEAFTGGQFGIKIEVISEAIAAAAALHCKQPVRYIPSLKESMLMSCKRLSYDSTVKMGADAQGKITAYCNDFVVDNGAYLSACQSAVTRSMLTLTSSYDIPNVDAHARLVYTNNPWRSAARGMGQPEINFPLEVAMDMLADKVGVDPFEFRLKNALLPGGTMSCGHVVDEWPFPEIMEALRPHYERAVKEIAEAPTSERYKRGVGVASGAHGIASPGDSSIAAVELDADGGVSVYAAGADPGEGNDAMFTQLTASIMDIPRSMVRLHTRDTINTAASGPAAGSRITYMIGGAVAHALKQLKEAMTETGATNATELEVAGKSRRYVGRKKSEFTDPMDPKTGQGPGFDSWAHSAQLAEVEVDLETGKVRVLKMTAVVDVGTVIHPQNVTGQMEGGMDMGMGLALREEYIAGKTKDWISFKFPTIADSCPMEVITVETPRSKGPLGATGVGEMSLMPSAPAVINAIGNATGCWICELPATPDKIKAALARC